MGLGWEEMSSKEIVGVDGTVITDDQEGYPDESMFRPSSEKSAGAVIGKVN